MVARLAIVLALAAGCLAQPRRIISTAPSITETLFALGLGDRVVGVTTFCRYPPEARTKPKIGSYLRPDVEAILALRPDLVIVEKSMFRRALASPQLKLPVLEVDDATIEGVFDSIRAIGRAAGVAGRSSELVARIRSELDVLRRSGPGRAPPTVLFIVGRTPGRIEDLIAAGRGSYISELIALAGGKNILDDAAAPYSKIGVEQILARNPDVILDMGDMAAAGSETAGRPRQDVQRLWQRFKTLKAVQQGRVYSVDSDVFMIPGPRLAEAARRIAELLFPESRP